LHHSGPISRNVKPAPNRYQQGHSPPCSSSGIIDYEVGAGNHAFLSSNEDLQVIDQL
jgi:hypothetical protein